MARAATGPTAGALASCNSLGAHAAPPTRAATPRRPVSRKPLVPTPATFDRMQLVQDLVCFTHVRWHWMASRHQQSFVRAAREYRVFMVEEPVFVPGAPYMDVELPHDNLTVARPCLPYALLSNDVVEAQRQLLDRWLASHGITPEIVWYHSPTSFAYSAHLAAPLTVYDRVTDPSPLPDDRRESSRLERALLTRANVVYTGDGAELDRLRRLRPDVQRVPADGGLSAFMATRGRPSATDPSSAGVSRITPLPGDRPREERADHLQIARLESSTQRGGIWEEPRLQRGT